MIQYRRSICRYILSVNNLQLKDKDQNKGEMLYIDRRPKSTGNIVGFINNTQPGSTIKKPNCILRGMKETVYLYVALNQ